MNKYFLTFIFFMIYKADFIMGQDTSKAYIWWINDGVGIDIEGINLGVNYNFSFYKQNFQLGYNFSGYLFNGKSLNAVNVSIGHKINKTIKNRFLIAGFTGPAYLWATENNINNSTFLYSSLGITGNFQFIYKPMKIFGIGIELIGNLNSKQSMGSIRGSLHISNF